MWRSEISQVLVLLKKKIVPRNFHLNTAFQFLKHICEAEIFHTFLNFITSQMFLLFQIFVLSNTDKSINVFENIQNILNFLRLQICVNFQFL
jgi:Na+-driven multidrug efflux pump